MNSCCRSLTIYVIFSVNFLKKYNPTFYLIVPAWHVSVCLFHELVVGIVSISTVGCLFHLCFVVIGFYFLLCSIILLMFKAITVMLGKELLYSSGLGSDRNFSVVGMCSKCWARERYLQEWRSLYQEVRGVELLISTNEHMLNLKVKVQGIQGVNFFHGIYVEPKVLFMLLILLCNCLKVGNL